MAAMMGLPVLPASAALTFDIETVFNGSTPPGGPSYLTARFADTGAGQVTLTLTSKLTPGNGEYIAGFVFNIDPRFTPSALGVSAVTGTGFSVNSLDVGMQNDQSPSGFGIQKGWDFNLSFDTSNKSSGTYRFDGQETATITFTVPTGVPPDSFTAESFKYFNAESNSGSGKAGKPGYVPPTPGSYYVAADIRGFESSGAVAGVLQTTTVTAVPEPSTMIGGLGTLGLLLAGLWRSRRT